MNKFLFKKFLMLFLVISSFLKSQDKNTNIDSLIIEMSMDSGSGPDFNTIKIYPHKKYFVVNYILYDKYNNDEYVYDPERRILAQKYDGVKFDSLPQNYFDRIHKITDKHTTFYVKKMKLKNNDHKEYLSELHKVSKLSMEEVKKEAKRNSSYLHGISFSFDFYSSLGKNSLSVYALEKDNYKTLYDFLINTFDLYRKQNKVENFNSKTFGY